MAVGEFDAVHIVFNKFESAIAYTTSCKTLASLKGEVRHRIHDPISVGFAALSPSPGN